MESARTDRLCRSSAMGIGRSNFMSVASRGREAFCVVFLGGAPEQMAGWVRQLR